jgi:hypothetical protein
VNSARSASIARSRLLADTVHMVGGLLRVARQGELVRGRHPVATMSRLGSTFNDCASTGSNRAAGRCRSGRERRRPTG